MFPSQSSSRTCFGRENYYHPNDHACRHCTDRERCVDEIQAARRGPGSRSRRVPTTRGPSDHPDGVELSTSSAGQVQEGESAFSRFLKDCATGACRGAAWESYQFFREYRF